MIFQQRKTLPTWRTLPGDSWFPVFETEVLRDGHCDQSSHEEREQRE